MGKSLASKKIKKKDDGINEPIVIDRAKNLVFENEDRVYEHFGVEITTLEKEYENLKNENDIGDDAVEDFEEALSLVFEDPDEVWIDKERFENIPIYTYIRELEDIWYVALAYVDGNVPTFIFLHFPTQDETLLNAFKRTERVYSREQGGAEADALSEGDELAQGLYKAMLTVRAESDIPEDKFSEYLQYRDATVEDADEIWRSSDLQGNVLVTFIKDFQSETEDFLYITITLEDNFSETHYVLFSFPTKDKNLVDRYRHGESLHTESVVQEDSH
jgi:hypothetical protein